MLVRCDRHQQTPLKYLVCNSRKCLVYSIVLSMPHAHTLRYICVFWRSEGNRLAALLIHSTHMPYVCDGRTAGYSYV